MRKHLVNTALVLLAVQAGVVIADALCVWQDSAAGRARREASELTNDNIAFIVDEWATELDLDAGRWCYCPCDGTCDAPDDCQCACAGDCAPPADG